MDERTGTCERNSSETQLRCEVRLPAHGTDVSPQLEIGTGLPFLDHMLEQTARYGLFHLRLLGQGDIQVDPHHLLEDAGIVFGQALSQALGDRSGIVRFSSAYAPLDDALARVVLDLGKRPYLCFNLGLWGRIGDLESETIEEWWRAFSIHAGATVHVDSIRGHNRHHVAESAFKALGLALRQAVAPGGVAGTPSSKGLLG